MLKAFILKLLNSHPPKAKKITNLNTGEILYEK